MPEHNSDVQESPRESRVEAPQANVQASDRSPTAGDLSTANKPGMDTAQNTVNKEFGTPSFGDSTQQTGLSKKDRPEDNKSVDTPDSQMEVKPKNQDQYKTPNEYPLATEKPEVTDDAGRNLDRPKSSYEAPEAPADKRESGKLDVDEKGKPKSFEANSPESNSKNNFEFGDNGKIDSRTTTDTATGTSEKVKYDGDGKAQSREVTRPGEAPESQPVDPKDTAKAEYDQDGKLSSIDTTRGSEKTSYGFSDNELKNKSVQNSGEVTKSADGSDKVSGKFDSRTAYEDGKEFESQKTNYNEDGVRSSQVHKKDDTTTTRHYDKSGQNVDKTEKLTPDAHSMEKEFADRKQTDTITSDGKMSRDTNYADGSSKSETYNPHTKERTITSKKDGFTAEMRDTPKLHQTRFTDKDGNWQRYDMDKTSGFMTETGSDGRRIVSRGS